MRTRSVVSGSVSHAEGPQESGVRVRSNLPYFLVGTSLERVGEHEHAQARMPVVRAHAVGERLELLGDDDDRRLLERFDGYGVADTPRRTRSSVAQAHHAALHEARPLVDVGARLLALRAGAITRPQHAHVGTVCAQHLLPYVDDREVGTPRIVAPQTDDDPGERPSEPPRAGRFLVAARRDGQQDLDLAR